MDKQQTLICLLFRKNIYFFAETEKGVFKKRQCMFMTGPHAFSFERVIQFYFSFIDFSQPSINILSSEKYNQYSSIMRTNSLEFYTQIPNILIYPIFIYLSYSKSKFHNIYGRYIHCYRTQSSFYIFSCFRFIFPIFSVLCCLFAEFTFFKHCPMFKFHSQTYSDLIFLFLQQLI